MNQPVAIVAGAGRGIGRAAAKALAGQGFQLTLVARTAKDLDETQSLTGPALVVPADVTRPVDVEAIVKLTLERFGRIDALINCAGHAPLLRMEQMSLDDWRETIDTNLSSVFYLSRAVWPTFRQQRSGVIVNLSSLSARDPFMGFAAYGAAKAGVNLLGLAWAREGQEIGVRVHTLAPGAVETAMFRGIATVEQFPTENTLDPDEVAKVIVQCVSGELRHTSGEVIHLHKTM